MLKDCEAFVTRVATARTAVLEASERDARASGRCGCGRSRALQRMLASWAPRARRLVLVRVDAGADRGLPSEGMHQREVDKFGALRSHWQPIFVRGATSATVRQE